MQLRPRPKSTSNIAAQLRPPTHDRPRHQYPDASLLGLPLELRLQVYEYCTTLPALSAEPGSRQNRNEVSKQRYFLQLVCRQVNHEWTPKFYSTTTIVVHGVR